MDDPIWDVTVFTKNRERLLKGEVAERLLLAIVEQAHVHRLLSEEHFTVDGTLIQAWVSRRSFREKQDLPDRGTGTRGRRLLRDTHESATDRKARLYRKSSAAAVVPSYLGHVLTENRNGLVVQALATQSSTTAEREAALRMIDLDRQRARRTGEITLGADKSYHHAALVEQLRTRQVVPHVAEYAPKPKWPNSLTEAECGSDGFRLSQQKRRLVEKVSAGPNWTALSARSSCAACGASTGSSNSSLPRTTSPGCRSCSLRRKAQEAVSPKARKYASKVASQNLANPLPRSKSPSPTLIRAPIVPFFRSL
jgi:hypothetical protein